MDHDQHHPPENGIQSRFARMEEKISAISMSLSKLDNVPTALVQIQAQMGTHTETFGRLFHRLEILEKHSQGHDLEDMRTHGEQDDKIHQLESKLNKIIWAGGGMVAAATGMWGIFSWILSGSLYRLLEAMKDLPQ